MPPETPDQFPSRHQELMLKIARRPGFCCCCIYITREDRRRARRIFRLTRRVIRTWEKAREEQRKIEAEA